MKSDRRFALSPSPSPALSGRGERREPLARLK